MPDKIIEFEGVTHHFPDSFTDSDIQKALSSTGPATAAPKYDTRRGQRLKGPSPQIAGIPEDAPLADYMAGQASRQLRNIATAATPAFLGPAIAHPMMTAASAGVGAPIQAILQKAGEFLGFPGFGELAGDIGGVAAGSKVASLGPKIQALRNSPQTMEALKGAALDMLPYFGKRLNTVRGLFNSVEAPKPPKVQDLTPLNRDPVWSNMPPAANRFEDLSPISGQLPSGRVPGQPKPSAPAQPRSPIWEGMPDQMPHALPEVKPIASSLPSGRVPGKTAFDLAEERNMVNAPAEPLRPIEQFEMNRMMHARAQEMNLPGSPAGKSAHPQLRKVAREVFGESSWSKLDAKQIRKVYDFLEAKKRLPIAGEIEP